MMFDDFEKIYKLLKELWPDYKFDINQAEQIFSEGLSSNQIHQFVTQINDEIIGFVSISIINGLQLGKVITINEFIVSKNHRRQGVGKDMFRYIESFAKKIHCENLELHSGYSRKDAHVFYENFGFEKVSHYFFKKIYSHPHQTST